MKYYVTDEQFDELIAHAAERERERTSARLNIAVRAYQDRRAIEPREEIIREFDRPTTILWGACDG